MAFRSPPNKGVIEFPAVLHIRVTQEMGREVMERGGSRWLRAIIAANTRPPADLPATALVSPGDRSDTSPMARVKGLAAAARRRVSRKPARRVSLDKRKGARVKSRVSRVA